MRSIAVRRPTLSRLSSRICSSRAASHVTSIGERGKSGEQVPQFLARKNTQRHVGQRLDRMLHLVGDRALQAQEIRRHREIQDLPAAVRQTSCGGTPSPTSTV